MPKIVPPGFDLLATPPRVLRASFYPCATGEAVGPFWSESNHFLLAVRGRGLMRVGPKRFELCSGGILHVPWAHPVHLAADRVDPFTLIGIHLAYQPWSGASPGAPRHHTKDVELTHAAYQTPPHLQPYTAAFLINTPLDSPLPEIASDIARTYETGIADTMLEMREARLRGLALAFIAELHQCLHGGAHQGTSRANAAQVRMVHEVASFMELALGNSEMMQRTALARRAGVSETTLAEAFRAVTGRGPIAYLIDLRIGRARRALRTSRAQVGEIAAQVGIPDIYYFSKLFKKRVGCSPLKYRTRLKI